MIKVIRRLLDRASRDPWIKWQGLGFSTVVILLLLLGLQAHVTGEAPLTISLTETHLVIGQEVVIHLEAGPPLQEGPEQRVQVHLRGEAVGPERILTTGKGIRALREDRITLQLPPDLLKDKPAQLQVELQRPEGPLLSNALSFTAVMARISGRVIRMVNGTPIAGVEISAIPGNVSTRTNEGGFYVLPVEKGIYTLRASASNFLARTELEVDSRTGAAEVYFELEPDRGQLTEALRRAQQAVQTHPADPQARFALGSAYQQVGQWKEAIAELSRVLELQSGHVEAHYQLALSYWRVYQYARAKEVCLKALEIDAGHQGLRVLLGRLKVEGY